MSEVTDLIPHRPPFLWVDKIISFADNILVTEKLIPNDLDIFSGHYPGNPIMPGVLLCEAIFQSGALLMGKMSQSHDASGPASHAFPVLTRISNARFKRNVLPGNTVQIEVRLLETVSSVSFFKGKMKVGGKTAVQVEFACAMVVEKS